VQIFIVYQGLPQIGMQLSKSGYPDIGKMLILTAVQSGILALGNQFIAMQKDSSLVSVMGVWEVTYRANRVARIDSMYIEMFPVAADIYWTLTIVSEWLQSRLEQHMARSDRH
jgi:polar amino acid transport system permease protein